MRNPDPFELLEVLRARCPDLVWHPGRVSQLFGDFPDCDHRAAVSAACDWINHGSSGKVRDGVGVLRGRLERQRATLVSGAPRRVIAEEYDRFEN